MVVQWLRLCFQCSECRVPFLVRKLRSHKAKKQKMEKHLEKQEKNTMRNNANGGR